MARTLIKAMLLAGGIVSGGLLGPAAAQDLPLDAFLGTYRGAGAIRFDLDTPTRRKSIAKRIVLGRIADGFRIEQTYAYEDISNPNQPLVRDRAEEVKYRRRQGVPSSLFVLDHGFDTVETAADPLAGGATGWAVIIGRTLLLNTFRVRPDGRWETTTNALTLDDGILEQVFQQQFPGQPPQFTNGSLRQDF